MTVATSAGGRPLKLIQTLLGLAIAGATLVGIPSTAGAAATPAGPPNGIEVLSPQEDQTLGSTPVPVSVRFTTAILAGSFAAELNGKDVTSRFTVGADTASAALTEADGIRIRTDKTPQSNTLQVWMTGHDDPSHRFHDRRAFVVKSGSQLPAPVSGVIPPSGGTLESPGFARVTFPAGAFLSDTTVGISVTRDPDIQQVFDETAVPLFDAANRLGYEVRVTTGTVQPLVDPQVTLTLPDSFRFDVPADSEVRVLAESYEDGAEATPDAPASILDTFELLADRFLASDLQITATMPRYFFTDGLRADGVFELTTLAATTPTAPSTITASTIEDTSATVVTSGDDAQPVTSEARSTTLAAGTCKGSSLAPPLDGQLDAISQFGPRTHPVTGKHTNHGGTDLRAATGTPVKAMADGVVERSNYQYNAQKRTGWGYVVVILHTDGSRTLYAHLQQGTPVAQGTAVHAGDTIGSSDSSGGVTGPHLHIEYAPNGKIYQGGKVDPMPCIGRNVTGSITVRDNGNLADDAFRVTIDGILVCTTSIGASNTCAVGNLRPGTKTLSLTAVIAPDNVGTYEISLSNGLTFSDGSTIRSGSIPQGAAAAYSIVVPSS
jgi:murein DD-endopeptidase MepM/ murein hydrolase activator NlpD